MNEINQRLEKLREVMRREHLSAFIFPSTDAHQSEYVADIGRAERGFQVSMVRQVRLLSPCVRLPCGPTLAILLLQKSN